MLYAARQPRITSDCGFELKIVPILFFILKVGYTRKAMTISCFRGNMTRKCYQAKRNS